MRKQTRNSKESKENKNREENCFIFTNFLRIKINVYVSTLLWILHFLFTSETVIYMTMSFLIFRRFISAEIFGDCLYNRVQAILNHKHTNEKQQQHKTHTIFFSSTNTQNIPNYFLFGLGLWGNQQKRAIF
jgi:hypothetical protein